MRKPRITFKIDVSNLRKRIMAIQRKLENKTDLWDRIVDNVVSRRITEIFDTDGLGTWLSTDRPNPILRDTLRLFRSYTDRGSIDNIDVRTDKRLIWGSRVPYAIYHESEERAPRIRARKVAGLFENDPTVVREIQQEVQKWVQFAVKGGGR